MQPLNLRKVIPVVYKVKDNKLIPTKVKIGLRGENEIEILSGLKEGEKVALKFVLSP
ncbi:hypothetical protein DMNBHIDG_00135 [Candidatus Methanoperedenaceae archaeon GB37]|nr:hypothetical protein DMNBHIDG_00135 [Candidatus Methanoperedenaceae archaeon GB37]